MPCWRLHYHLVWATWERAPLITANVERVVHQIIFAKARELGLVLHAVGGVSDHVHVVVSIPPTRCVAEIVKQLKGASSRAVHLSGRIGLSLARRLRCIDTRRGIAGACHRVCPAAAATPCKWGARRSLREGGRAERIRRNVVVFRRLGPIQPENSILRRCRRRQCHRLQRLGAERAARTGPRRKTRQTRSR